MQSYEQFKTTIRERFSAVFPDTEIRIHPVTKNNGTTLDGLIVLPPGSNISPTVYLDQIYDIYRDSGDFEAVWQDLYAIYREYGQPQTVNLDFLTDFAKIRPHLYCRLISAGRNADLLGNIPHRPFLDLAVICYIGFSQNNEARGSILVTDQMAEVWKVPEDELFETGLQNNREHFPAELISLSHFLMRENPYFRDDDDEPVPLYILTNSAKCYGACALLDPQILEDFAEKAGDFYILPSSLHEVLLISKKHAPAADALNEIIRDVNSNHLDPTDILSDHLYTYSVRDRCIRQ